MRAMRKRRPGPLAALAAAALAGCAATGQEASRAPETGAAPGEAPLPEIAVPLFDAETAAIDGWRLVPIWREMEFLMRALEGEVAFGAVAEGASAALVREVSIDPENCPVVEWSWRVESLPAEAELSSRESEDVAASIILAFGDPGSFLNPDPVPTLRYVWATDANPTETVIDSPYYPGTLRSLVVRSGPERLGGWVTERRDLAADYEAAFGEAPSDDIEVVALFTDSDHGGDRVEAFYRAGRAMCLEAPEGPSIFASRGGPEGPTAGR